MKPKKNQPNPEKNWFGARAVEPNEKTGLVRGVFDSVADRYDLMNDLMSGGLHRLWKDRFVRMIRPRPQDKCIDVAGGTGDIAFRMARFMRPHMSDITICDLNHNMLTVGRDRAFDNGCGRGIAWATGNAEFLPFPDSSFDVYTIAFGLRNVTHIDNALNEAIRVLRPGGRFFCLEFSPQVSAPLQKPYDLYSEHVIPAMGGRITGDSHSYRYLIESIRRFPAAAMLKRRMENAGFAKVAHSALSAGIVNIHKGIRP